jgi:hypothetical protein
MLALALQFSRSSHRFVANTKLASSTASGATSLARKPTVRTGKRENSLKTEEKTRTVVSINKET